MASARELFYKSCQELLSNLDEIELLLEGNVKLKCAPQFQDWNIDIISDPPPTGKPESEMASLHCRQLSLKARMLQSLPNDFVNSLYPLCVKKQIMSMQYLSHNGNKPIWKVSIQLGEKL